METQAAYPALGRARYAQCVLGAIALVTSMDTDILALLLEPIKHDLGLTDVEAGLANSTSYYAAYGLLSAPLGRLVDRANRVSLIRASMLVWCAALVLVTFASGFWTLFFAKVVMGAAAAAILPAALSLYGDYFAPERRASATSTFSLGQLLGSTGALLIGGLGFAALTAHPLFGLTAWRAVFLACSALAFLIVPASLAMREPARMELATDTGGTWRELWAYRGFLIPLLGGVLFLTGLSRAILTWVAPALMRLYDQQPGDFAGWLAATKLTAGIVGVVAAGRLVEWARRSGGHSSVMIPAAIGAAVCAPASCMALAPGVPLFVLGVTLFMLAYAVAISVPIIAINFRIPNELRGRTMGLYVVCGALGAAVSTPAVAKLGAMLGGEAMLGQAMAGIGVPFALLAALFLGAATRRPRARVAAGVPA